MRDSKGRFEAGVSGNPLGRPRAILSVRDLARSHTDEAIATLAEIMRDPEAPANARISAASELLNRGYGRHVPAAGTAKGGQRFVDLRDYWPLGERAPQPV